MFFLRNMLNCKLYGRFALHLLWGGAMPLCRFLETMLEKGSKHMLLLHKESAICHPMTYHALGYRLKFVIFLCRSWRQSMR